MSKLPLPASFSDGVLDYSLVYFPGLPADSDPRYSLEPPIQHMTCLWRGAHTVEIAGRGKMHFSGVLMQQPPMAGTTQPSRQFLFFRLGETPMPLDLLQPSNMICYAVMPRYQMNDPIQGFVNSLFGQAAVSQAQERQKDTWAKDLFQSPENVPEKGIERMNSGCEDGSNVSDKT